MVKKTGEDWIDFWDSAENAGSSKFIYLQALFVSSPFYLQLREHPLAGEGKAEEVMGESLEGRQSQVMQNLKCQVAAFLSR